MFSYLHCYLPETWDAQVRAGLINDRAGIRFAESIDLDPEKKFNRLARTDGPLYPLVRGMKGPFYIDRLQGGCFFEGYPYDMALTDAYRALPGDRFWGFQMHEWMSNYSSDLGKLTRNACPAWTEEKITETILRAYPFPHVFLESMNAREMAEGGNPGSWRDFLRNAAALYRKRRDYTGGALLPCDSFFLAFPVELAAGTKRLMPEIGAQTPDTRLQLAYARGMTRGEGYSFGAYYEPWGGRPFSVCCYQRDGLNEWNLIDEKSFPYRAAGANGGSSRSLQRRMHLYAYMAGASFMAEEWGMCNTFYDWHDFVLSPYGEVKKEFIRFTERYPDIGRPLTPAAAVIPDEVAALEMSAFDSDAYLGYPSEDDAFRGKLVAMRRGLDHLFRRAGPMRGDETASLRNCVTPDAVDVVNEAFLRPEKYRYLVDLTGGASLARRFPDKIRKPEEIDSLLEECLPCAVRGNVLKQFTENEKGEIYLLLTNNSGVERSVEKGESTIPDAAETVSIRPNLPRRILPLEGDGRLSAGEDGLFRVRIPAGGYFFAKLV
ncbi:MAG: hypothetical protein IKX85_03135 [Clostridia bacterium]|nr:hypothetical protein [Clostridia bacterium]